MIQLAQLLVMALALSAQAQGATPAPANMPKTPQTALAAAYLDAYNSGDEERMRRFLEENIAKATLERTPITTRLERFRQVKQDLGARLELARFVAATDTTVILRLKPSDGPLCEFTFELEPTSPPTLRRIRVEALEEGESEPTAGPPKATDTELVAAVEQALANAAAKDDFSGVALVAKGESILYEKAVGMADREAKIANRVDTKFNVGSINKIFTNIAIRQLADQGKLRLDDTLGKYLPDYPNKEAAARVRISNLLSMTSGIGDFFGERYRKANKLKIKSIKDYLPLFADLPLEFEPGTRSRYSNGGYIVLGAIIEAVSGVDYYSYIKRRVYGPAGMTDSDWYDKDSEVKNRAVGYTRALGPDGALKSNYDSLPGKGSSAGGGYSTVRDLFAFTQALRRGTVSTPDFQPDSLGIAGGAPGLNAVVETSNDYTIIVMANLDPPAAERVGRMIRGWLPR